MGNIVFLIGNGFDVGMGMPTQYKDFYDLYVHPKSKYYPQEKISQDFASTIDANKPHWSYYEETLGQYARKFPGKDGDPLQEKISHKAAEDYVTQHENFQNKFYEYLKDLTDSQDFLEYNNLTKPNGQNHMIHALKQIIGKNYKCKICKTCQVNTSDNEKNCKACKKKLPLPKKGQANNPNTVLGSPKCAACKKRVLGEGNPRSTGDSSCPQSQMHSEFYSISKPNEPLKDILKNEQNHYYFLSFNYTTVLDKCLDKCLEELGTPQKQGDNNYVTIPKSALNTTEDALVCVDVCHVHGKLTKRKNDNELSFAEKPVMGVNDPDQILNTHFYKNDNVLSHFIKSRISDSSQYEEGKARIRDSDVIIIYGMSVGITDQCWWDLILEHMNQKLTCQLVVYVYDTSYQGASPNKKDDIRRDWLQRMCSSTTEKKLEVPSNRISFVINRNEFSCDLRKNKFYLHPDDQLDSPPAT